MLGKIVVGRHFAGAIGAAGEPQSTIPGHLKLQKSLFFLVKRCFSPNCLFRELDVQRRPRPPFQSQLDRQMRPEPPFQGQLDRQFCPQAPFRSELGCKLSSPTPVQSQLAPQNPSKCRSGANWTANFRLKTWLQGPTMLLPTSNRHCLQDRRWSPPTRKHQRDKTSVSAAKRSR